MIVSIGAIIIAFTVAKLVDCCCKKTIERDGNIESLDDQTKKILRARLIVIQMKRKEMAKAAPTLGFLKRWSTRTAMSRNLQTEAARKSPDKQTVINVEEADDKEKKNNSLLGGFLKQNKVANGIPSLTTKQNKQHSNTVNTQADKSKSSEPATPTLRSGNNSAHSQTSVPSTVISNQTSPKSDSRISSSEIVTNSDPRRTSNKSVTFSEKVEVKTEDELENHFSNSPNQVDSIKVVNETPSADSNKPSNLKKPS